LVLEDDGDRDAARSVTTGSPADVQEGVAVH
jgi:hypothetical protein